MAHSHCLRPAFELSHRSLEIGVTVEEPNERILDLREALNDRLDVEASWGEREVDFIPA